MTADIRDDDVVVLAAVRTPIGRIRGALSAVRADDLAAVALRAAVERSAVDVNAIEEVFLGCANQAGEDNRNVARMGLLLAGLPDHIAGVTVNRLCASGLNAVNQAARVIRCGEGDVMIAGGVESMTRAPFSVPKQPVGFGSGNITGFDTTLGWRYPNPAMEKLFPLETMGETAENVVERSTAGEYGGIPITREMQDEFALESQRRAVAAINGGRFDDEIVPVEIPQRRGDPVVVAVDEHPRYRRTTDGTYELATSAEELARLRPAFREGGSVTAGNSSGLNDGACAMVLASGRYAKATDAAPLARWVGAAAAGVEARVMGIGPIPATEKLLSRHGLTVDDIDLAELNEAFAAQSLAVIHALGLDRNRVNVNGGAIALGHPLGCSGARILTTLVHEMRRRSAAGQTLRYGLATLCVGVGQGEATLLELL